MTAQRPDILINEYSDSLFEGLKIYRLVVGKVDSNTLNVSPYEFQTKPVPGPGPKPSSNWKGYIRTYKLTANGELFLWSLGAANPPQFNEEQPLEKIEGNFWLVAGETFFAPKIYIPFINGRISPAKEGWFQESAKTNGLGDRWRGKYYVNNIIQEKA